MLGEFRCLSRINEDLPALQTLAEINTAVRAAAAPRQNRRQRTTDHHSVEFPPPL